VQAIVQARALGARWRRRAARRIVGSMAPDPDQKVEDDIETLIAREHELRGHAEGRGLDEAEQVELKRLEVRLDQLWDLLRRRRALRAAGQDPGVTDLRDEDVVENYRQ